MPVPVLVLGLPAECANLGLCGVDGWAVPELGHALCRPRSRSEGMLMNEASARLNLEHVDLAAELQMLRALSLARSTFSLSSGVLMLRFWIVENGVHSENPTIMYGRHSRIFLNAF